MKIQGNNPLDGKDLINKVREANKQQDAEKKDDTKKTEGSNDKISLSGKAKEMGELKKLIHDLPEIRTDKIEAVKKSIDNGTYTIDPLKIAGKIIEEES